VFLTCLFVHDKSCERDIFEMKEAILLQIVTRGERWYRDDRLLGSQGQRAS